MCTAFRVASTAMSLCHTTSRVAAANGNPGAITINAAGTEITINNANAGTGGAHNNVQPTIIVNKLLRVI